MSDKAVIFDMDGVLVDSYKPHYESWNRMANRHGLEMSEEQFAKTFGRTSRDIIRYLWGSQVPEEDIPAWDEEKEAAYRDILRDHFPEMDGASELISALHRNGFAMAIGSSGPPDNIQVVLDELPCGKLISETVDGTQVSKGKPDPEVFLKAAKKLGVPPHRCAVIEDAPAGVQAAGDAKMASIAITGTAPKEQLAQSAHLVIDTLRTLTPQKILDLIENHAR